MPATVAQVHVSSGQTVQAGDLLVSLEAMKMHLPIRAPAAGVVKAVFCREGDMVQPDTPLLELE
jgi:3-methylcrotonyl-CoA carboxylase alpha subunit